MRDSKYGATMITRDAMLIYEKIIKSCVTVRKEK